MPRLARFLELLIRFAAQRVALALLRADVQKANARIFDAEHFLRVVAAKIRELQQVFDRALGVRAAVDEHRLALGRRDGRRERRAAKTPDALDNERRARKERARAARADKAVRVARVQHIEPHGEGRILLVLKGRGRIVADLDHLGRVGDLHALGELLAAALLQGLQNFFRFSGQDDVHAVLLLRHQRALDGRERGEIAAHGVDDDLHGVTLLSCHSARPRASRRSFQASARRAAHFSRACRP